MLIFTEDTMVKKDIKEIIEIPEGANVLTNGETIKISKAGKEIERKMGYPVKIEGNKLIIECLKAGKKEKKLIRSLASHVRNAFSGFDKKYTYKLQICSVHFPMNVAIKGRELIVKNFLGEVKERKAKILDNTEAKIEKDIIIIESYDKEKAGQTAANIERATRITKRDRRVFQDGIYLIQKQKGKDRGEK